MTERDAPPTYGDALGLAVDLLNRAGVENAAADARLLMAHALGSNPTSIVAHEDDPLPPARWARFEPLLARRIAREPLQHLVERQAFWSLDFHVDGRVLIPRPETEHLLEAALEAARELSKPRIADVGTGTGCLALSLAVEIPFARIVATDVSPQALEVARRNAVELSLEDRVRFVEGDLLAPLEELPPPDLLVANLPYVAAPAWEGLEPEVRDHEPRLALVGGQQGTELIFTLIAQAAGVLAQGAWLGLEVGHDQGQAVAGRLREAGWDSVAVRKDFAGIDRIVEARRPG